MNREYGISAAERHTKQLQLLNDYNLSKKITIQNGNTLIINHDTPERDIFLNKLEKLSQESKYSTISISYQQKVGDSFYRFSALPTIWSYVFKDLFSIDRLINGQPTGFKENMREANKLQYDVVLNKILTTDSEEEFDNIAWSFINPQGTIIDINDKANQMLADENVDSITKQAINALKDENGEIHLIEII